MNTQRVLVVEDDPDILDVIDHNLRREGYTVLHAGDGETALSEARRAVPDVILLDVMIPGLDGVEVCKRLRQDPLTRHIPVILVSARSDESDVVLGLGVGADDYVVKPFSPKELVARVKARLRPAAASGSEGREERIAHGGLVVDPVRHAVFVDSVPVDLTATQFRLLKVFARNPGRVFTRDELLTRVIRGDAIVTDRNIDVHVRAIRRKLGSYRDLIETIRGVGYRFGRPGGS